MTTGDLNLVGDSQQLVSLLTGDIIDESTYGPDFNPDWDGTDLADVVSRQTEARFAYTWRNDFSSFSPGRLDFLLYNDSVLDLARELVIYTPEMSAGELSQYGLLANDVTIVSDHLPLVADFRVTPSGVGSSNDPSSLRIASSSGRGEVRIALDLEHPSALSVRVFDIRGRFVQSLREPGNGLLNSGTHTLTWNGRTRSGIEAASGRYVVRASTHGPDNSATVSHKILLIR